MLTDRQKKVVKIIVEHDRGIYANEIAKSLKVSTRTIRNDIAGINLVLKNSQCSIQSSKRTGYFIMQENINRIKDVLKTMDALNPKQIATSSKQRKYYILGKLMNCHAKDLGEMADELYVSEQTVYKDLTGMIHHLDEKYHFYALSLENGQMILQPKEIEIRTLVYRLIKEEIYLTNRLVDIHLYQMIRDSADMEELNDIVDYISAYCRSNSIVLSDQMVFVIAWMIFFTMLRSEGGYHLERNVELFNPNEKLSQLLTSLFRDLKFNLTKSDCHLLQNYIETLGFYSNQEGVISGSEVEEIVDLFTKEMLAKYNMDFTKIPSLFENFKIHLQFTIKRLLMDYQLSNPLLKEVKVKYAFAYEITMLIVPIIHERYGLYLSEDEISFLTMYVMPFLKAQNARVKTILVSGTSQSFANMLHVWLNQEFGSRIDIVTKIPMYRLEEELESHKVDLVISDRTIDKKISVPLIEITQLPGTAERQRLESFIVKTVTVTSSEEVFHKVFNRNAILFFDGEPSFAQIIQRCSKRLMENGNILDADAFAVATMQREQIYHTHIDHGVFFAHPLENEAVKNGVCVGVVRTDAEMAGHPIRIVFVGAHEPRIYKEMIHIYDLINKVAASSRLVGILCGMHSEGELIDYLERIVQII